MNDAQANCGHCPGRQQLAAISLTPICSEARRQQADDSIISVLNRRQFSRFNN